MLDLIRNKIKSLKEDAVSDAKAKHVDEIERLKTRQERELEQLKSRQQRQTDTAKSSVDAEKEREKQRKSVSSEETSVKQDKDVKDKEGTQPAKYYAGDMSKSTKDKRDAHFKAKKTGPAPGDHDAETKPSKHTTKFKKMFGEDSLEEDKGLQAKADKSGISKGILQKVYNRGLAAFKTGHRPGATAPQWAMARVNSFITKGSGTWGGADKDLAKQAGGKSESIEESVDIKKTISKIKGLSKKQIEALSSMNTSQLQVIVQQLSGLVMGEQDECWDGYTQKGMKKKGDKMVPNCVPEEMEEGYAERLRDKTKSQQKAHQKAMMKSAKKSIKDYDAKNKNKNEESEVEEDRDYKKEYENYQGKPEQIKRRAKRNEARRSLKDRKDIKGKDVHHKDNNPMNNDKSNLSVVSKNFNRKEPRLRELKRKGALPKC